MEVVETMATKPAVTTHTSGQLMYKLIEELFPICRSITGNGVRQTLEIVKRIVPIVKHEVPSGTRVFDWEVPREWNIRDAYIVNPKGQKIVDFHTSNLHVLNYSVPVRKRVSLAELKEHLFTLPEHPDRIPYCTSYYQENWGFCMPYTEFQRLRAGTYEVVIDSTLKDGHLTWGEYYIQGESTDEVLISTHICHPSLANDNLSGISVATFLARELRQRRLRYSYRFLFIPGTIGAITWLSMNELKTRNIKHGMVVALVGNHGKFIYKKSRAGNAEIDQITEAALEAHGKPYEIIKFSPYGYDERQYGSPGFNLPVGSLTRARNGEYPEYHTSADNLEFVKPAALEASLNMYLKVFDMLEANRKYLNTNPKCEPQLGKRGLYDTTDHPLGKAFQSALLWVLNYSDGNHSLLDISRHSELSFELIQKAAEELLSCKILIRV
jgi:aminopeptidase-like protein